MIIDDKKVEYKSVDTSSRKTSIEIGSDVHGSIDGPRTGRLRAMQIHLCKEGGPVKLPPPWEESAMHG
jgi:hypothetical protein